MTYSTFQGLARTSRGSMVPASMRRIMRLGPVRVYWIAALLVAAGLSVTQAQSLGPTTPPGQAPDPAAAPVIETADTVESDPMRRLGSAIGRCPGLAREARRYRSAVLNPMRDWAEQSLADIRSASVFYPFSGPDAATAVALFPDASRFLLIARQQASVEQLVEPDEAVQASECELHQFVSRTGFYRTHDLDGKERPTPRLLTLLLMSLETAGVLPLRVAALQLDPEGGLLRRSPWHVATDLDGHFRPEDSEAIRGKPVSTAPRREPIATARASSAPERESGAVASGQEALEREPSGIRVEGLDDRGRTVVFDYLSMDLSDRGVRRRSLEYKWIESEIRQTVLIKSASHLLQSANFSNLATLIARHAQLVVQDETGLDALKLARFSQVRVHGEFTEPYMLWRESLAMGRLREFVDRQLPADAPPFPFGYRKPSGTFIVVASGERTEPPVSSAPTR